MDSPSDLSPNAPPVGIEDPANFFKNLQGQNIPSQPGPASTEGSVDSSGFEKVDHDVLEEYGHNFAQQMQQSIFGQLPEDPDNEIIEEDEEGFILVERRNTMQKSGEIQLLHRIPGDIDKPYPPEDGQRHDMEKHDLPTHLPHEGGDLIDIPRNESPVAPPVKEHSYSPTVHEHPEHSYSPTVPHYDEVPKRSESPLVPEPAPTHIIPPFHEEKHEEKHEVPVVEDLLDFGETAKELVEEAVREADDKIHQAAHQVHDFVQEPEDKVDDVHDEVDDMMEQLNENDDFQEEFHTRRPDSRDSDDHPDFRHTPDLEETIYERNGPLTIPELPERTISDAEDDVPPPPHAHHHHGFETEPRPPTPPKDISDEDVKPSLVNLGHGHPGTHTPHFGEPRHSILKHAAEPWIDFKHVDPRLLDLIYWRDPKKSAIALALSLLAVFVFAKYPLLSILSYTGLAVLAATLATRIFKAVEAQIKKTGGENPFQEYLNKDLSVPQEKVHAQVDVLAEHGVCIANKVKKLVFVENIIESVKFILILWSLTYVSAWFSGFGLIVLTILGIFTIPKVYETYQEPIDAQIELISGHINNVVQLVEEKLPFLKRAAVEVEKKDQ